MGKPRNIETTQFSVRDRLARQPRRCVTPPPLGRVDKPDLAVSRAHLHLFDSSDRDDVVRVEEHDEVDAVGCDAGRFRLGQRPTESVNELA